MRYFWFFVFFISQIHFTSAQTVFTDKLLFEAQFSPFRVSEEEFLYNPIFYITKNIKKIYEMYPTPCEGEYLGIDIMPRNCEPFLQRAVEDSLFEIVNEIMVFREDGFFLGYQDSLGNTRFFLNDYFIDKNTSNSICEINSYNNPVKYITPLVTYYYEYDNNNLLSKIILKNTDSIRKSYNVKTIVTPKDSTILATTQNNDTLFKFVYEKIQRVAHHDVTHAHIVSETYLCKEIICYDRNNNKYAHTTITYDENKILMISTLKHNIYFLSDLAFITIPKDREVKFVEDLHNFHFVKYTQNIWNAVNSDYIYYIEYWK